MSNKSSPPPYSIELHDSTIDAVVTSDDAWRLQMRGAYIHCDGKGWSQDVDLVIGGPVTVHAMTEFPAEISNGSVETPRGVIGNLLELPFTRQGPIRLSLVFVDGSELLLEGASITAELLGERRYIEDWPY